MPRLKTRRANTSRAMIAMVTATIGVSSAQAAVPITGTQLQSNVGTTVLPDFQGGTLRADQAVAVDSHAYTVENFPTNTVDAFGHTLTFTGAFTGAGPLTITDSVGGGTVALAAVDTYSGTTTINSGAKLQLGDGGGVNIGLLAGAITDNGSLLFNEGGGTLSNFVTGITGTGSTTIVSGTLQLSGNNTYTGSTTVNGGATFELTGTGSIAASSGVVDNGTFDISGETTGVSITSLSGSGALDLGTNTLTLTNASGTFTGGAAVATGGLTISAGTETLVGTYFYSGTTKVGTGATLQLGDGAGTAGLLGGAITDNGLIVFNAGGGTLVDYITGITGSGGTEVKSGTLELTGINTYSGTTLIDSGATLELGDGGGVNIGLLAGAITDNGVLKFNEGAGSLVLFATGITGTGTAELASGTLELVGTNTYSGATTIDVGSTLQLGAGGTTGTLAGPITDNGSLQFNYSGPVTVGSAITGTGNVEFVAGNTILTAIGNVGGTVTIDNGATLTWGHVGGAPKFLTGGSGGVIDNGALVIDFNGGGVSGTIPISGTGSVTLMTGSLNNAGVSTYTGSTTIASPASLLLSNAGSIAASSGLIDNGLFDIAGTTAGTSVKALTGSGTVNLGSQTLTITAASGTFSGVLADGGIFFPAATGGSLTISAGSQTLSGTNTFTGTTTVNPGATLQLGAGGTTGTVGGPITDNGALKFNYSGSVTVASAITGTGNVEVVAGTAVVTATGSVGGTVTIDNGATLTWGHVAGAPKFLTGGSGGVIDNGALVVDFNGGGVGGTIPISGTGSVTLLTGSLNNAGVSTYTGSTTIASPASLLLTNAGSIATSSSLIDNGLFDIAGTTAGTSVVALTGSGKVNLGSQALTITNASGTFSGVLADGGIFFPAATGGSLTIAAGSETLTGTNTFTGTTTVNPGATLQLGAGTTTGTVGGPITDNGALKFNYSGPVTVASAITGSGNVEVVAGTAVITASGSVGGTVTIDNGATLEWGHVGGAPEFLTGGSGGVVDNGALVIDFNGGGVGGTIPISGSGTFTILTGSLNNAGVSTYTGSTTIASPAILLLSGAGSIANSSSVADNGIFDIAGTTAGTSIVGLSGSGKVNLGSKTLTITNASGTFSGVLADGGIFFPAATGGGLTIAGGSETLTGTNTYTGTTTVASGATLQLGAGGATGTVAGPITDNGMLKFDYSGTTTNGNAISGAGNAELVAGTLVTTAASTIGGSVKIDTGATLQWGNGALGFLAGNAGVINNGALVLNFGGGSLSGPIPISGPGTFTILSGKFTNAGVSTYTGTTTIASGASLLLSGAGTIAGSSAVTDNGTFDISQTAAGTSITMLSGTGTVDLGSKTLMLTNASGIFAGTIADGGAGGGTGGSLTIAAGSETLDGVNTYTGTTTIGAGATLMVGDAAHPGASIDSHTGGVLVGAGATLEGHGTIGGAVSNTSGGTVAPGGTIGTLTVASYTQGANSTLQIEVSPTAASELNSLGAANLNGTLHLVFNPGIYSAHEYEIVAGNPVSGTFSSLTSTGSPGLTFGLTYTPTQVDLLVASTLNAQVYGGISTATLDRAHGLAGLVEDRLRDLRCTGRPDEQNQSCEGTEVWGEGFGATDGLGNQGTRLGFSNNAYGFVGGVDEHWSEGSTLGAAFSYESDTLGVSAAASKASGSSYFGALYGRWVADGVFLDGEGFYMHSDWDVSRVVPGFGTALSSPSGDTKGLLVQVSAPVDDGDLRPYLRGTYADFDRASSVETGVGAVGYAVASGSTDLGMAEGGLIWSHGYAMSEGLIRPALQLGFEDSFGNRTPNIVAGLAGVPGTSFTISSASPAHTSGVAGASLSLDTGNGFELTGDVRALVGSQNQAEFTLGAVFRF